MGGVKLVAKSSDSRRAGVRVSRSGKRAASDWSDGRNNLNDKISDGLFMHDMILQSTHNTYWFLFKSFFQHFHFFLARSFAFWLMDHHLNVQWNVLHLLESSPSSSSSFVWCETMLPCSKWINRMISLFVQISPSFFLSVQIWFSKISNCLRVQIERKAHLDNLWGNSVEPLEINELFMFDCIRIDGARKSEIKIPSRQMNLRASFNISPTVVRFQSIPKMKTKVSDLFANSA